MPRVLFLLLRLYKKLPPKRDGAKQSFTMFSHPADQHFGQVLWPISAALYRGFDLETYRPDLESSTVVDAPLCGTLWASLKHDGWVQRC